ncbi:hypothetical protein V6Z12_A10G230700 [Gossypium hirsutum]
MNATKGMMNLYTRNRFLRKKIKGFFLFFSARVSKETHSCTVTTTATPPPWTVAERSSLFAGLWQRCSREDANTTWGSFTTQRLGARVFHPKICLCFGP